MPILFFLILSLFAYGKELPEPYQSVELLEFDPHSYYANGEVMSFIIKNRPIKLKRQYEYLEMKTI